MSKPIKTKGKVHPLSIIVPIASVCLCCIIVLLTLFKTGVIGKPVTQQEKITQAVMGAMREYVDENDLVNKYEVEVMAGEIARSFDSVYYDQPGYQLTEEDLRKIMLSIENKISSGQLGLPDATIDLLTAKITETLFTNYDIPGYQAQIAQMSAELAVLKSELRTASSNGNSLTESDVARIVANSGLSANTVTNWANANGTTISKEYVEADKVVLDTAMKSDKTIMEALEDAKKLLNSLSEGKMDTETVNKTVKEMTDIINTLNTAVAALSDKTSDEDGALRAYLQALADELSQTRAMLSESAASDKAELSQKAASDKAELTQNLNDTKQELETNMANNKSELQNKIQEVSDLLDQTVDEINNNLTTQLNQLQSDLSAGLGAANDRMDAMNVYTAYAKNITYDAENGLTAEGFSLVSTADSRFIGTSLTIESSAPTDPSAYNWTPYRDYSITLEGTTLTVNIDPSTNP